VSCWHNRVMWRHINSHSGEPPFTCNMCNKLFIEQGNLKVHQLTHSGGTLFLTVTCVISCWHSRLIWRHFNTHSREPPFTCNMCNKSFMHQGNLIVHHVTHRGDPPFNCGLCNMSFMQQIYMKECNVTCDEYNELFVKTVFWRDIWCYVVGIIHIPVMHIIQFVLNIIQGNISVETVLCLQICRMVW
jgi:transcription elongation factor Elf1